MRLLILTQKVDKNDPILGFFHNWIKSFSRHFDKIVVVGLYVGEHSLPNNVSIFSLGKERGVRKTEYLINLFRIIWSERKNYDSVFVHMNQEYVILAGWLWRLLGKKIYMWRNHYLGGLLTDVSSAFCHKIFCTSRKSFTAKYKKTKFMPVGIDINIFKPDLLAERVPNSILSVGRISPSKNIHLLIDTLGDLKNREINFVTHIYGDSLAADTGYLNSLKRSVEKLGLSSQVTFHAGVPNTQTPLLYAKHQIFVNLSRSGMYDKTILEAAACGCQVLAISTDAKADIPSIIGFKDKWSLVEGLEKTLNIKTDSNFIEKQYILVETKHSLKALTQRIRNELNSPNI